MFEINSIQFGIISDNDIIDISVCEINKPSLLTEEGSVYDPRLGCISNGILCETCEQDIWKCSGHFGHINLNTPIILFYKQVVNMLKIFCFECHRILSTKKELILQGIKGYNNILDHLSKMTVCGQCGSPKPEIKLDTNDNKIITILKLKTQKTTRVLNAVTIKYIFENIPDEDVQTLGVDVSLFHPRNLVLTKFPVIPTCCRPRVTTSDNVSDDDLSIILVEIIKNNNMLEKNLNPEMYEKVVNDIKFHTLTYCDNTKGKSTHTTNHKPLTGIKERITKKTGHVRQNLMGKRCNRTARTVLGPEPTLKMNEVGIPEEIASLLTIPIIVTSYNIENLTNMLNNTNLISLIIKKNGNKISAPIAKIKRGTVLNHGDVVSRKNKNGVVENIRVTNCKMQLFPGDEIKRDGQIIPLTFPEKKNLTLQVGDIIERSLQNGDYILLNRQPTLHRNSMQGMKVVVKPGKTIRMNLAIVTGFNADFDGDEGNIFAQETIEARTELEFLSNAKYNMLSAQANKPEMVIVQDSLLGAYLMTSKIKIIDKSIFMQCMMRISHNYNYDERLKVIQKIRKKTDGYNYTSCSIFGFIMPNDFYYKTEILEIEQGVVKHGYFDKNSLKGGKLSIIRLLAMEYDFNTAMEFVDNIQFLTNCWLEMFPFTVGIKDCLIGDVNKQQEIQNIVNKYFLEANNIALKTEHHQVRESRVNCSLNKAKDIGLKIAKSVLLPDNNFNYTVASGSKGDYFNIAQITGLLGQQNLDGFRPGKNIDNNKRSLIHYPRVIINDPARRYKSRGFISSSFIAGMKPDEMFFHAMTGRDGMIKTAMETATSGYIQRSIIKMNEDLKIEYDGTVRDAKKNIYQFIFGNHGFDTSLITKTDDGKNLPVLMDRISRRFQKGHAAEIKHLSDMQIDDIVQACDFFYNLPEEVNQEIKMKQNSVLKTELKKIKISSSCFTEFKEFVSQKYFMARACPGECIGIIGAQSIGEKQTQTTLNTFHTAGKLQQTGVSRLEEILNMSKNLKIKTCTIYFKKKYNSSDELRNDIGSSITGVYFKDLYEDYPSVKIEDNILFLDFDFIDKVLFVNRINPFNIAVKIKQVMEQNYDINIGIKALGIEIQFINCNMDKYIDYINELDKILVCGMVGVRASYLDYNNVDKEWFIITEGSNVKKMLAHPLIDGKRLYCNDFWEIYNALGITAVRKILFDDLVKICSNVNEEHIRLLVDKMTYKGKPCSINRYTMRTNDCGPLSKATFEESVDILISAAMRTETENNSGISAAVISGNQPRVGTGFMDLVMDIEKMENDDEPPDCFDIPDIQESYIPDLSFVPRNVEAYKY